MVPRIIPTETVLFDLDDTLFDHLHCCRQGLIDLRRTHECFRHVPIEVLERDYLRFLNELHEAVLKGDLSLEEARVQRLDRLLRLYGESPSSQLVEDTAAQFQRAYRRAFRAVPGSIDLLTQLKPSARIVVITNNLVAPQQEKILHCGFSSLVDDLVVSEDVEVQKPDPAIFHIALARASSTPDVSVMVGDRWDVDVLGARAAGIRAVWLNRTGAQCPDAALASEIRSFEPVEGVVALLLGIG
jgi:putative hydrolase of the HAD superfamily